MENNQEAKKRDVIFELFKENIINSRENGKAKIKNNKNKSQLTVTPLI